MNSDIPTEEKLETLINIYKLASLSRPIESLQSDAKDLFEAQMLLETRKDEIEELNRLITKLDAEIGNLRKEIEARKAELQDAWKYQSETEAVLAKERIDSINRVYVFSQIDCAEFAVECAHDGPNEEYALYRVAMEALKRLRSCLTVYDNDASDIPF